MKKLNFGIAKLAAPLILSNLTVPLLGFTNICIAGHLHHHATVAAIGLGVMVFNLLFLGFAFLRMGTTGLVAQAYGKGGEENTWQTIAHSLILSLIIGILIILLKNPIGHLLFGLIHGDSAVKAAALQYYSLRVFAAPATLMNYVLVGAFIGLQMVRMPLLLMLIVNGLAVILGLELSMVYHLSIRGIAIADIIAQYTGALVGIVYLYKRLSGAIHLHNWRFNIDFFRKITFINSNIFLRTLFLISTYSFFTLQSLKLGPVYLAANTVLMSFMTLTSFAQDGFANVAEVLVGKNVGRGDYAASNQAIFDAGRWALVIGITFSIIYLIFGRQLINVMTSFPEVRQIAKHQLIFIIFLPLISMASFFLDGVFIGATKFREMRNTMFFSFSGFLIVWWSLHSFGNIGLWIALLSFFVFRGLSMGGFFWLTHRKNGFYFMNNKSQQLAN